MQLDQSDQSNPTSPHSPAPPAPTPLKPSAQPRPPREHPPETLDSSAEHSHRRTGKIARLTQAARETVNVMLRDGVPYATIIKNLAQFTFSAQDLVRPPSRPPPGMTIPEQFIAPASRTANRIVPQPPQHCRDSYRHFHAKCVRLTPRRRVGLCS